MNKKTAVVFGISGMDACILSSFLLDKGYKVVGVARHSSSRTFWRLEEEGILDKIEIVEGDITDQSSIDSIIRGYKPDEVYSLAALSYVGASWDMPITMMDITGLGPIRILESIRNYSPLSKFYNAGSSEQMGRANPPQNLDTKFDPQSLYAVAKVAAFNATAVYRRSYNLFAVSGILFNHTGKYRGPEFFERKISMAAARIKMGLQSKVSVGNLASKRDYGHSKDYMEAAWLMMQNKEAKDYVIGSGETHTMAAVCKIIFDRVGLDYTQHVEIDPKFFRPAEVDVLLADPSEARRELNWTPKYAFTDLMHELIDADLERVKKELRIK